MPSKKSRRIWSMTKRKLSLNESQSLNYRLLIWKAVLGHIGINCGAPSNHLISIFCSGLNPMLWNVSLCFVHLYLIRRRVIRPSIPRDAPSLFDIGCVHVFFFSRDAKSQQNAGNSAVIRIHITTTTYLYERTTLIRQVWWHRAGIPLRGRPW